MVSSASEAVEAITATLLAKRKEGRVAVVVGSPAEAVRVTMYTPSVDTKDD